MDINSIEHGQNEQFIAMLLREIVQKGVLTKRSEKTLQKA